MDKKNKTGLSRSENGRKYFDMKRTANTPINELFSQQTPHQWSMIQRHLDLGTIKLSFYNKETKKEVSEIEVTTPFILNAKVYDSRSGKFIPNNNVSKIVRSHVANNSKKHLANLERICKSKGLEEEFRFFDNQFRKYDKRDDTWFEPAALDSSVQAPYIDFYSGMDKRFKEKTGKKFMLNPYVLTYLELIYHTDHFNVIKKLERTIITIADIDAYLIRSCAKLHIKPLPKKSFLSKALGHIFKWCGLEVDHDKLNIDTFGDECEDLDHRLNYEVLPAIHTDYSRLSDINLDTVPCELWVELFKLNNDIPPFLVPDDTVDEFTEEQLKEIVTRAPRIILEWHKPELFNLYLNLPITEVYPILTFKQKCDQLTLAHLGFENRQLIPESMKCISSLDSAVLANTANLSEIYHLLSEDLRLKHWKGIAHKYNLEFVPDHRTVAADFEHLVVKTLFEHASHTHYPSIHFDRLHAILQRDPEKLINSIVHLCEIGFDPKRTVEPHTYWMHGIEQITIEGYEEFQKRLSPELQSSIEICGMVEDCVIHIDKELATDFRKALHCQQLQAKIPNKVDAPKKKNKL